MDDVTDVVFREIIADIARPDVFVTEFTSVDAMVSIGAEKIKRKLQFTEKQRPIVAQIWGAKPENYFIVAQELEKLGFDGIDINMGCPDKNVVKLKSGSALINKTELVSEIVDAVKKGAPNTSLSIKTRLDVTPELTEKWISYLLSLDIDELTIHGRDAPSLSKVDANWDEIGKVVKARNKAKKDIIVVGNGDVKDIIEVEEKYKKYGVDGVMIGRSVFHNPWLFDKNTCREIHYKKERIELLLKHTRLFESTWGKNKNFETMKKFFKIYIKEFIGADKLRQKLMLCKSYDEVYEIFS